jgi:osmoprotectant transport system permease protein
VHFLSQVASYLTTWSNWRGADGIGIRLAHHVEISLLSLAIAMVIALPVGLWLGHSGRAAFLTISIANIGRALPSFAILVAVAAWRIGATPAIVALVLLSIPPVLTNAYTGVAEVDPEMKDAARGMGMTGTQILRSVELPSAVGLIFAGVRTAAVQCIATATLAAYAGYQTLGSIIREGLATHPNGNVQVFAGGFLVVVLALIAEIGLGTLQRALTPRGLRLAGRVAPVAVADVDEVVSVQ